VRCLLVPVKSFRQAKLRLAEALSADQRYRLARDLADIVLGACGTMPTFVACDDDEVADWASARGATVLWTPGRGLSGAVTAGVGHLATKGFDLVVVAHADLPLAFGLEEFGAPGSVTLAPDHRIDGTNVAAVPANAGFAFSYGPGSFARHRDEAVRLGLSYQVVYDWRLASDVDLPSDLAIIPRGIAPTPTTLDPIAPAP
jgi:2-phospho-L-lactate guanylyltransferase